MRTRSQGFVKVGSVGEEVVQVLHQAVVPGTQRFIDNGWTRGSGAPQTNALKQQVKAKKLKTQVRSINDKQITSLPAKTGLTNDFIDPFACTDVDPVVRVLGGSGVNQHGTTRELEKGSMALAHFDEVRSHARASLVSTGAEDSDPQSRHQRGNDTHHMASLFWTDERRQFTSSSAIRTDEPGAEA
jgi:hypothetical protein